MMPPTKVVFFKESDGSVPALDWLDSVPAKARVKILVRLERLRDLGYDLRRPEADLLHDGIFELRVGLQGIHYRLLYFFHGSIAAFISHGLVKERIVPTREIDRALERKSAFASAPGEHTYGEE